MSRKNRIGRPARSEDDQTRTRRISRTRRPKEVPTATPDGGSEIPPGFRRTRLGTLIRRRTRPDREARSAPPPGFVISSRGTLVRKRTRPLSEWQEWLQFIRGYQDWLNANITYGQGFDFASEGIICYATPFRPHITEYRMSSAEKQPGSVRVSFSTEILRRQQKCHYVVKVVPCPYTGADRRHIEITVDPNAGRTLFALDLLKSATYSLKPVEG